MSTDPRIATASLSDVGEARSENQDFWGDFERGGERLMIIADGMGGHRGGATASRLCVDSVARVFQEGSGPPDDRLRRGLELANEEIYTTALKDQRFKGMGTTAVAAIVSPRGQTWIGWIGDSRAYRRRAGSLELLTADHSLVAEWIRGGILSAEEGEKHPRRNELTRAIGSAENVEAEVVEVDVCPGDTLLLCSDGLWGVVPERQIGFILASMDPVSAARALVDAANANGGPDNVTVQIMAISSEEETAETESTEVFEVPEVFEEAVEESFSPAPSPPSIHISSGLVGAALAALVLSVGFVLYSFDQPDFGSRSSKPHQAARLPFEPGPRIPQRTDADQKIPRSETLQRLEGVLEGGLVLLESLGDSDAPLEAGRPQTKTEPDTASRQATDPAPVPVPDDYDLEPSVQSFVDSWLEAVSSANYRLYYELGFRAPLAEFRRTYGTRESFQLVDAEVVDTAEGRPVRIYLRVVLSYVFESSSGRFRTEDTHRIILEEAPDGLRFAGSWQ
jgi:protein phosphatase